MRERAISTAWAWFGNEEERSASAASDQEARFALLYQRTYPAVLGFLRLLVGSPEVAEDLTALVFEKALAHFEEVRAPESATAWLFRIARHAAADYFRRAKPTVSLDRLLPVEHPQAEAVEEGAIAREEARVLLAHLERLPGREREVIGLKFVAQLTNREIARVLQIPEGTVSSTLYRALRRLRTAFNEKGGAG
ncbi:MAG TPA: sigma-70 family RNA polymerase sigma factor [Ktedonobacterales bacterium]|jgi:RNA polymerase sigma-70 factor (ECF subfamily)